MSSQSQIEHNSIFRYAVLSELNIPRAAQVMADAFVDSPTYKHIMRGTVESRRAPLEWLFTQNMYVILRKNPKALRGVFTSTNEELIAAFMCTTAGDNLTFWEIVQAGLYQMPWYCGLGATRRLIKLIGAHEDHVEKTYGKRSADMGNQVLSIMRMAVVKGWQGRGVGSLCVRKVIEEGAENDGIESIRLETQEVRNVRFYQKLGFKVIDERVHDAEDEEYSYTSWAMELSYPQKKKVDNFQINSIIDD